MDLSCQSYGDRGPIGARLPKDALVNGPVSTAQADAIPLPARLRAIPRLLEIPPLQWMRPGQVQPKPEYPTHLRIGQGRFGTASEPPALNPKPFCFSAPSDPASEAFALHRTVYTRSRPLAKHRNISELLLWPVSSATREPTAAETGCSAPIAVPANRQQTCLAVPKHINGGAANAHALGRHSRQTMGKNNVEQTKSSKPTSLFPNVGSVREADCLAEHMREDWARR